MKTKESHMKIEVLGTGCPRCEKTKENIEAALSALGRVAEITQVKDLRSIAGYGVIATPAVVVDGKVKMVGRVPTVDQIKTLLT
jgi:small redox-active disulfide protein 2